MSTPTCQLLLPALLSLAMLSGAEAATVVRTVGADAACDFRTDLSSSALQDAITSVPENFPAGDEWVIRVANNGSYGNATLLLEHRDLTLAGGFSNCADNIPDPNSNTVISGNAAASEPVLTIRGQSRQPTVILRDITVRDGQNDDGSGGGIYIDGAVVRLLSSIVTDNRALHGGGVAIRSLYQDAVLELDEGSGITGNTASSNGGGIDCYRSFDNPIELQLHSRSSVSANQADGSGGGIHSDACSGFINSGGHGIDAFVYNIGFNDAGSGGGINAERNRSITPPAPELVLGQNLKASDPRPVIANNSAGSGGGVRLSWNSRMRIHSAVFVNNTANTWGGAIDALNSATLIAERTLPRCADDRPCIAFSDNQAASGGALSVRTGSLADIDGAWFEDNSATGFGNAVSIDRGTADIENSVFTDHSGSRLFQVGSATSGNGELWLRANTIAGNGSELSVIDIGALGVLSLGRSIIQAAPAIPILSRDPGNHGYQLSCNLLNEQASVAGNIDDTSAAMAGLDPGFVDASGGDFHLHNGGRAVDACPDSAFFNDHDHDLNARPVDAPATNLAGPFDVGAYEWTYAIFRNGFEE
ncbi:MAG: hypothetical protein R3F22_08495 [Lysobacteraceae bacterium]